MIVRTLKMPDKSMAIKSQAGGFYSSPIPKPLRVGITWKGRLQEAIGPICFCKQYWKNVKAVAFFARILQARPQTNFQKK
jgi:hypothetical protein